MSPRPHNPGRSPLATAILCLVIAAGVAAVYSPTARYPLIHYDDMAYVAKNPMVGEGLSLDGVKQAFASTLGGFYIPLVWISFQADQTLWAGDYGGFHTTNVIFHGLTALILFFALFRMTGRRAPSFFAALVFAVHPLNVESVAWVTERKDVLFGFFYIAGLLFYSRYAEKPGIARYVLVAGAGACALLSKPMAVTFPLALLILDYWPLERMGKGMNGFGRAVVEKVPLFALSAGGAVLTLIIQTREAGFSRVAPLPLWARAENAVVSYATYVTRFFAPRDLAVLYPHPMGFLALWKVALAGAFLLAVTALAVKFRKKAPFLLAGWLWFLVTLVPVSGILQSGVQASADRFTYIPMVGLALILSFFLASPVFREGAARLAAVALGGAFALFLAYSAAAQARLWQDTKTLFTHTLAVTQNNWLAHTVLGRALLDEGENRAALTQFERALAINPTDKDALFGRATAMNALGLGGDNADAFRRAAQADPKNAAAWYNLARALSDKGDTAGAARALESALTANPGFAEAWNAMGMLRAGEGKNQEAADCYQKALAADKDFVPALYNLGTLLARAGNLNQAAGLLDRAVTLDPGHAMAWNNLGNVFALAGQMDKARVFYQKAASLDPENPVIQKSMRRIDASLQR